MKLTRYIAAELITFYQKYLSPRKGFRCAYRVKYGGASCSQAVKLLVLRHGVIGAWPLVVSQFRSCTEAYRLLVEEEPKKDDPREKNYKDCPAAKRKYWESPDAMCCAGNVVGCCSSVW